MVVKIQDLMELSDFQQVRIVAGQSGIDRVMHWTHIVDLPDVIEWVQGGELLFTTGIGIRDNLNDLTQIVRECNKKGVAGLVINIGPYIQHTPSEVIALADELGFPIFEVPWETKLVKVTRAVYNLIAMKYIEEKSVQDILENVLDGNAENRENLIARAASFDFDLTMPHQIMVIKFEQLLAYLQETGALTEQQILVAKLQIQNSILGVFERMGKKVLSLVRLDTVLIMLPTLKNYKEQQKTKEIGDELLRILPTRFVGLNFRIGWGNVYEDISAAKRSLAQAEQAIRVVQALPGQHKSMGYEGLGFYKVLFSVNDRRELEAFRNEVLDVLLEYDKKHGAELVNTLSIFLEENENFARVSERLFIHRNTLKYRLQKIIDISGRNMADPNDRMHLYFATIVNKFLHM